MLQYLVIFAVFYSVSSNFAPTHNAILKEGVYYLYWQYTHDNITFEAQVKTTGYVGFGISPNGGMTNSDIVIGWVKDGKNYFKDRFATGKSLPAIDPSQDWTLLNAVENGTWTSLRFTRKLKTCDKLDLDITEDTMRVIWSYHTNDPTSETDIPYHTERGVKSLQLLSFGPGLNPPVMPDDAFTYDIIQPNISVPNTSTTYWCTALKIERYDKKHHVIKYEPIIPPGHESLVHHIIVYSCGQSQVNETHNGHSVACRDPNMPDELKCFSIIFAWAIGGGAFYFPENVGLPFGEKDGSNFVFIETHYDNPKQRGDYVDASGLRITLTPTARQYDAGILNIGHMVTTGQIVPPGVASFRTVGTCPGECTKQALASQPGGIKIFTAMLHSHLLGRKIRVRHIRKGKELPVISEDNEYDFNYQETRQLKTPVTVLPGDELRTECTQDSTGRTSLTLGGESTSEEMCLSFLMYYPRIKLSMCQTSAWPFQMTKISGSDIQPYNFWAGLSIYAKIAKPAIYANKTAYDVLSNTIDWKNETIVKKFEMLATTTPQFVLCMSHGIKYPINANASYFLPEISEPLPAVVADCVSPTTSGSSYQKTATLWALLVILAAVKNNM